MNQSKIHNRITQSLTALITSVALFAVPATAQMASNGGTSGSANTAAFGQGEPFHNVTTQFDGIKFNLRRLINNPGGETALRLVATLENTGQKDAEIFAFYPAPTLIDELGNMLATVSFTGVAQCEWNGRLTNDLQTCAHSQNIPNSSLLAANVPIPVSFVFSPAENQYEPELAALSNTVTARLHFAYTLDGFETVMMKEVVIPNIPLPQ